MAKAKKEPGAEKLSKKELSKTVFEKLSGSIAEYHLKEKKQKKRLEKVSKLLAGDIAKVIKKETVHKEEPQPAAHKKTRRAKKAAKKTAKKEKAVAAE